MSLGLHSFIGMSDGLPRNLLIILKLIFKWAIFYGEQPFRGERMSSRSQRGGILEAAEWFFEDARGPGLTARRLVMQCRDWLGCFAKFDFPTSHPSVRCVRLALTTTVALPRRNE